MSDYEEPTVGDEEASEVDESGRNLTQQRLDEEQGGDEPADVSWDTAESPAGEADGSDAEEARGSF